MHLSRLGGALLAGLVQAPASIRAAPLQLALAKLYEHAFAEPMAGLQHARRGFLAESVAQHLRQLRRLYRKQVGA